jgi:hypothetical protein
MKALRLVSIIAAALLLIGCGSATEVGNPTGSVPTRTLTGTVDTSALDEGALLDLSTDGGDSATEFSVVATSPGEDEVEAPIEADGSFTIRVTIRATYWWEVRRGDEKVGDFSFEQTNGLRRNSLRIENEGDDIDMGTIRFQGGEFVPENEPIEQDYEMSPFGPLGGDGGGQGGNPSDSGEQGAGSPPGP